MRNGKLGCARADHHDEHEPKDLLREKLFVIRFVIFRVTDGIQRNECEEEHIEKGDQSEQARKYLPIFNAENDEEARADENGRNHAPAIERMEQTHDTRFIFRGTGFHDGTDENFQKSAADGIKRNGDQKSCKRMHDIGQKRHGDQSERAEKVRCDDTFAITELMRIFGSEQVGQKLNGKINGNQKCDLLQGDTVSFAERQKQKRRKIDDDRLRDIADEARTDGVFMV